MPKVYNWRDRKKIPIPADAVWVDRRSRFGNPFVMKTEKDRPVVISRFVMEILEHMDVSELKGKDLICWCSPRPCHADYILNKANS